MILLSIFQQSKDHGLLASKLSTVYDKKNTYRYVFFNNLSDYNSPEGNHNAIRSAGPLYSWIMKIKNIVFGMIETMLTKKKFKDFFNKNVAAL
ncbi:hypothetical protein GCM10027516_11690 [Niabella aquatica]